jgi:regulatory protein
VSEGDASFEQAYARAIAMLAARARSSRDLRKRLVDKGVDPSVADKVIARLIDRKLLDDGAYAESRARASLSRGRSSRRVLNDLASKGVDRSVASAALGSAMGERGEDERAVCERAAQKKLRSLTRAEPAERRQKLYAFLARQGFASDVVRAVVRAALAADGAAATEDEPVADD